MKWVPNNFHSDVVQFTWLDLIKLAFGKVLKDGGLIAVCTGVRHGS